VAAALGNATLLGLGYLFLRRWKSAVGAVAGSAVLLLVVSAVGQPAWPWRAVLVLWWLATIAHAWLLAGGRRAAGGQPARAGWQRAVAVGAAAVVCSVAVGVAADARRVDAAAADAHRANHCDEAVATWDQLGFLHRAVHPLVGVRAEGGAEACELLAGALAVAEDRPEVAAGRLGDYLDHRYGLWRGAAERRVELLLSHAEEALDAALDGSLRNLESGIGAVAAVLVEAPDRVDEGNRIVAAYLDRLPDADACHARSNVDWLHEHRPDGSALDRAMEPLDEIAPPILVACGDQLVVSDQLAAQEVYGTLLDRYPAHPLAGTAALAIEGAEVRRLLEGWPDHATVESYPPYCEEPAPYRGAEPYSGPGPHRVAVFGDSGFVAHVPAPWQAEGLTDTVLVLCVDTPDYGAQLGTCRYGPEWQLEPSGSAGEGVTLPLHVREYRILAYELHSGELVSDVVVASGGDCPPYLYYAGQVPDRVHADGEERAVIRSAVEELVDP
jgi:hypothetical protein